MERTGSERRKVAVSELVEILQQSNGKAVSRRDLASMLRLPDRTVRALVEQARRQGVPIISPPGYRLARTMAELEGERQALRQRALAILATVGALAHKGPAWLSPEKQAVLPGMGRDDRVVTDPGGLRSVVGYAAHDFSATRGVFVVDKT